MTKFIEITENDGQKFLLNLDLVVSIHPTFNQMTGKSCHVHLLNDKDEAPMTIKIDYDQMKKLLEL